MTGAGYRNNHVITGPKYLTEAADIRNTEKKVAILIGADGFFSATSKAQSCMPVKKKVFAFGVADENHELNDASKSS